MFKIPKKNPYEPQNLLFESGVRLQVHPSTYSEPAQGAHPIDGPSLDQQTILLVCGQEMRHVMGLLSPMTKCKLKTPQQRGVKCPTRHWFPTVGWAVLECFGTNFGSILKDRYIVHGDVFPDFSNPKIIVYDFNQKHICKTRRNLLRLTRSFQGKPFERHERSWTFDLQTSRYLTHFLYAPNKSFNYLINSWISHKYIKSHVKNIGDLVVEHRSCPVTFDFQCT